MMINLRIRITSLLVVAFADIVLTALCVTRLFGSATNFLGSFHFVESHVEFLICCILRSCICFGAAVGLCFGDVSFTVDRLRWSRWLILGQSLILSNYALIKVLVYSEKFAHPWSAVPYKFALVVENFIFSWLLSCIWYFLFRKTDSIILGNDTLIGTADLEANLIRREGNEANDYQSNQGSHYVHNDQFQSLPRSLILRLISYCKYEIWLYSCGFTALFIYSVSKIFVPYYMGTAISLVVLHHSHSELMNAILMTGLLSLCSAIFGGLRSGCMKYAINKINLRIRQQLFGSIIDQEIGFFDTVKTDTQTMSDMVALNVNIFLRCSIQLIGSVIFMFRLSWQLAVLNFICIPLVFVIGKVYGTYYEKLSKMVQDSLAKANEIADEAIGNVRTVHSFANENGEKERYNKQFDHTLNIMRKESMAVVLFLWNNECLSLAVTIAVLWYGGHLVLTDRLDGKLLVSFLLYQIQVGDNLGGIGEVFTGLMQASGASSKVFEYIDRQPKLKKDGKLIPKDVDGEIVFDAVCLAYPSRPNSTVLNKMSFVVSPGEVVALVGPSGGGKSSCFSLLQHFYEPHSGNVLIDGCSITEYDHSFYHRMVSMVGQEPVLFGRSITENIAYGLEPNEWSFDKVVVVAKAANAHEFVEELTDKYCTETGEKGSQLSGGQKQRIAIARSLIRKPKILLLDEATSALDSESEHKVQEALYKNLAGHTVLLIAHRLSTVEKADRILVVDNGQIVQQGNHRSLLAQDGLYRNLVHRQLLGSNGNSSEKSNLWSEASNLTAGPSSKIGSPPYDCAISSSGSPSKAILGRSF